MKFEIKQEGKLITNIAWHSGLRAKEISRQCTNGK